MATVALSPRAYHGLSWKVYYDAFAGSSGGGESERYAQGSLAQTGVDELAILDGQHNFGQYQSRMEKWPFPGWGLSSRPGSFLCVCLSLFPKS